MSHRPSQSISSLQSAPGQPAATSPGLAAKYCALAVKSCKPAAISRLPVLLLVAALGLPASFPAFAQTPAAAPAAPAASRAGTVKSISGSTLVLTADGGKEYTVTVADGARILQVPPGSKDLKTAQTIQLTDVAAGDRILVSVKAADAAAPDAITTTRVILMKSTDIAQLKAQQQADWQRRGSGGIVSAVDPAGSAITVSNGARKTQIATTTTTIFRRYAGDSVRFEDAQTGTLSQIQPGDQVRVRGAKSDDGSSIQAEEIVSGTFLNLAGTIATLNAATGTLTLKDLATKKNVVVKITANSEIRTLPPEVAARFARTGAGGGRAGAGGAGAVGAPTGRPAGATSPVASTSTPPDETNGRSRPAGDGAGGPGAGGPGGPGGAGRAGGRDLSQIVARLPQSPLSDLKPGEAVMIVASQTQPGAASVTAVSLLSGVEPILAATPTGGPAITISPFAFGGGAPEGGGGQ